MSFHIKRYGTALRIHWRWAWLAVLPVVLYLSFAAVDDVTYTMTQDFAAYSADLRVAAANSPIATIKLGQVVAEPDLLFLDAFALTQLQKKLGRADHGNGAEDNDLRRLARFAMSLSETRDSGLALGYTGNDAALGRVLIKFYSDRLLKQIADGEGRLRPGIDSPASDFRPVGPILVSSERALWRSYRLTPALFVLFFSSLGVLVLIAVIDFSDPSFKSERQIARYLGVPVLGTIPDAEPLVRALPGAED